ncbi:MAG: GAF domain-containing protein, partial [Gammaproteobacteria bacterium]|nr:GAF domain-containing protein [Gammaproteobacteria bacterium]
MKIKTKLFLSFSVVLGVMLLVGIAGYSAIRMLHTKSMEIGVKNAPLADAVMEMKLAATTAHLWFEEIIIGMEKKEAIADVWKLLDESLWYCDAILTGGKNEKGTFYPVNDPAIEAKIRSVKSDVTEFIQNAHIRFDNNFGEKKLTDQDLEDRFDALFEKFVTDADEAEVLLHTKMRQHIEHMDETANTSEWMLSFTGLLGIVLALLAAFYISREIMRQVGGEPADIAKITKQVAEGRLDMVFESAGKAASGIYAAVQVMVQNLKTMNSEREAQDWLKTGQAQLGERISGEQEFIQLAENIINFITPYVSAQVGAFYLFEEAHEKNPACLKMIATHAYTWRKSMVNTFEVGRGVVGQAALERKTIIITQAPEDYIVVQTGLGESPPRTILVAPFL